MSLIALARMMNRDRAEFSVYQFFKDDTCERVRSHVGGQEAVHAFYTYATSVGARIGSTVRVIVTDGGDNTNMEWKHGIGVTYPPEAAGRGMPPGFGGDLEPTEADDLK